MLPRLHLMVLVIVLSSGYSLGQVEPPKLDPTPATEKEAALIKEGTQLHDQGQYDAAISKYEEVLKENPNNVEALYEAAFSYSMKRDYQKSLELAYKGAQYKSKLLAAFYMQIGNNLDHLGKPEQSVKVYEAGIKLQPRMAMLHYNLAITYLNLGKTEDAKKAVKQSITLNPNHPSSHLVLMSLLHKTGYRIPALLAACRFLVLEPKTARSTSALNTVRDLMGGGVTPGKTPNQINITIDAYSKKDEGDFEAIDLVVGLARAASMTEKNKNKTEMQLLAKQFETVFAIISEQVDKADQSKFTWKIYVPYFVEMKRKNHVEPFVYYIYQSSANEEAQKWLQDNKTRVDEFLSWSKAYVWPKAD